MKTHLLRCRAFLKAYSVLLMFACTVFGHSAAAQSTPETLQSGLQLASSPTSYVSEKDTKIREWIDDIVLLATDPKRTMAQLDVEERTLDDRTRDRLWALVSSAGLKSSIGRFSGKPYDDDDLRKLMELYKSALENNPEAIMALEAYSTSTDAIMAFQATNVLAMVIVGQNNQDRFIDLVNKMIEIEAQIPADFEDEYNFILLARLQEKAVYTQDVLLVVETTRDLMVERYRLGLGQFSAFDLYNVFQILVIYDRFDDAALVVEAMRAIADPTNVQDIFFINFASALLTAETSPAGTSGPLFDQTLPLAEATRNAQWVDLANAYAAREYALAKNFETARERQAEAKVIPIDKLPYADIVNFEQAFAEGDLATAEAAARKLIEREKRNAQRTISPGSWSRYKMYENEVRRSERLAEQLETTRLESESLQSGVTTRTWLISLLLALLAGVVFTIATLIARARSDARLVRSATRGARDLENELKTANDRATALSNLLEATADEITRRLGPSLTLVDFASRSSEEKDLPFAAEAKAALRSFSVLSLDLAAVADGRLPKPSFETVESRDLEKRLRRRLREHMDGDASCDIKVELSDDMPGTMVMDSDRVLHIVMCLIAGAWRRSQPAPVQVKFSFDRFKGVLSVDVIDVGGIVPANIEDQFSQLPSNPGADTEEMLLRLQYAASEKLIKAMGGTIEFDGSHTSPSGHGLKATARMPVIRQTSEEGTASYVVTAPG